MDRTFTPQPDKQQFTSHYLKQIVSQGQKRFETYFEELEILVNGGFYNIVKVINKIDQQIYAVKKIEICLKKQQTEVNIQRVLKEVRYMAQLSHPNIMRYYNSWIEMIERDQDNQLENQNNQTYQSDLISPLQCTYKKDKKIQQLGDLFTYCLTNQQPENHTSVERISYSEVESISSDSSGNVSFRNASDFKKPVRYLKQQKQSNQQSKSYGQQKEIDKIMIYIQTEFCDQSLEDYIMKRNNEIFQVTNNQDMLNQLTNEYLKNSYEISLNLLSALDYIHSQCQLVHRDLRPSNIFINNNNDLRIGDFGLMKKIKLILGRNQQFQNQQFGYIKEELTEQHNQLFQAPELTQGNMFKQYDHRVDIYTLGLIFFILFYPTKTEQELISAVKELKNNNVIPLRLKEKNQIMSNIIASCIEKDPNKRNSLNVIRMKLTDSQSQGSTNDIEIIKLGMLYIQFEDEVENVERYLTLVAKQLHIYKTNNCTKAQIIYNLSECDIQFQDEKLLISHQLLMSLIITGFQLDEIDYLKTIFLL